LRTSFLVKLVFVGLCISLAAAFAATTYTKAFDAGASVEWAIGFVFSLYIFSFSIDLYPAIHTKNGIRYDKSMFVSKPDNGQQMNIEMVEDARASDSDYPADAPVDNVETTKTTEMIEGKGKDWV
jgi:D-alanyl-lipoteichoic acid acyltransferase DltB (MBOAT superfamily)